MSPRSPAAFPAFPPDGSYWNTDALFAANPATTPGLKAFWADAAISCNINDLAGWHFKMAAPALYGPGPRNITVYRTTQW